MKFERIQTFNFENAFRGMRNPKESWHLSDSKFCFVGKQPNGKIDRRFITEVSINWEKEENPCILKQSYFNWLENNYILRQSEEHFDIACIGPKDMRLAQTLIKAGSEHRKFMRQIFVTVDITAPLYWWKECDTYHVGTTANSTSTMHKLATTPITLDRFETVDYDANLPLIDDCSIGIRVDNFINDLERLRQKYLQTNDKKYWKELIRWLPESWLQTRTFTCNYENILSMIHQRNNHKLTEWSDSFINDFARKLPYAEELLFLGVEKATG